MFSHVFIGVRDFERALAFYRPVLAALGLAPRFCDSGRPWAGWQTPGQARPPRCAGLKGLTDARPARPAAGRHALNLNHLPRIAVLTFFQRIVTALLLCLAAHAATAAEPPVFAYAVICDDPVLAQRLRSGIEARFDKLHVQRRDQFPNAKLFIYANRDSGDDKNPDGVSVAIAHTSNLEAAQLALSYISRKEAPPELLQSMLRDEGMLLHLRVAHLSAPSDPLVNGLLDEVVTSFVQKYSPHDPSPAPAAGRP